MRFHFQLDQNGKVTESAEALYRSFPVDVFSLEVAGFVALHA